MRAAGTGCPSLTLTRVLPLASVKRIAWMLGTVVW